MQLLGTVHPNLTRLPPRLKIFPLLEEQALGIFLEIETSPFCTQLPLEIVLALASLTLSLETYPALTITC